MLANSMLDSSVSLKVAVMTPDVVYVASGEPSLPESSGHSAALISSDVQSATVPVSTHSMGSAVHAALSSWNPSSVSVRSQRVASIVAVSHASAALQVST